MSKKSNVKRTFVKVDLAEAEGGGLYYEVPGFAGKVRAGDLVVVPIASYRSGAGRTEALATVTDAWKAYEEPREGTKLIVDKVRTRRFRKEVAKIRDRRSLERILSRKAVESEAMSHIRGLAKGDGEIAAYLDAYDKLS